jgi:transcriptional regulator with GAF, ATPase, and Fis domain
MANARKYVELTRLKEELIAENRVLRQNREQNQDRQLIGREKGLKDVYEMITLVAPLNNPVLILGETGTGKEVAADTIHRMSKRSRA